MWEIQMSNGTTLDFLVKRDAVTKKISITPQKVEEDGTTSYIYGISRNDKKEYGLKLYFQEDMELFEVGEGDILVFKGENSWDSSCDQSSFNFDYGTEENALLGEGRETFMPKRICIFQLGESDEKRKLKTKRRKEREDVEKELMKERKDDIEEKTSEKIRKIEKEIIEHCLIGYSSYENENFLKWVEVEGKK